MSKQLIFALTLCLLLTSVAFAAGPNETRFKLSPTGLGPALLADVSFQIKADLDSAAIVLPGDIGERIDLARYFPAAAESWPVVLLLHSAELASGKSSPLITARQLLAEATTKARNNSNAADLALASHIYTMLGDVATAASLQTESQTAAAASSKTKAGLYTCDVIINNYSQESVFMWCNGVYVTEIPSSSYYYETEVPLGTYYLAFHGAISGNLLGGVFDWTESYQTYTVELNP